jgi:hypothetical protein
LLKSYALRSGPADADVAALGYRDGALESIGKLLENTSHLVGGLEVELIRREAHPLGVVHRLPGLDAQQDLVCPGGLHA